MFYNKKIICHTCHFQGWVGGFNQKRHFDVLRDELGMDVAPYTSCSLDWNSPCRGERASHQEFSTQMRQREELNWVSQPKSSDQQIFWTMSSPDLTLIRQD